MADLKVGTTVGGSPVWHQGNLALVPSGNAILYKGARIYSENDKPSATELQVVSRAGDTMTGQLVVETSTDYPLALKSSVNGPSYIRFSKGNTLQSYVGTDSAGDFKIAMTNGAGSWAFDGIKIAKSDATVSFKGNLQSDATGNFDIKYGSIQFIRANSLKDLYIGAPGGTDLVLGYSQDGMTTTKIRMNSAVYNRTGGLLISDTGQIQRSAMDNPYYNQTEADARFIRLNTNTATNGYLLSKSVNTGTPDNLSMGYSGFFRHDTSSGFRDLTINVAHPNFSNGAHARGITFNLGSTDYKLYTYAYDASGTRLANQKIYTEADKPTPAEIGALPAGSNAVSASKLQTARTISLTGGATGSVSFDGSANVSLAVTVTNDSHTHSDYVKKIGDSMSGNLTVPKVLLSAAQGAEANAVARRDFVESTVDASGKGRKDLVITLPSGAPSTGYIPVLFATNGAANSFVYISTFSGSSSIPMNNCSFIGEVRTSGWSDGGSYAFGRFEIYSANERSIHSIHGPSESTNGYVIYVETRAFPINVRVDISTDVTAFAGNATYGTSVFAVNGQDGVGNTKTMLLADFTKGSGQYSGSQRVYDTGYNPTPEAVGALPVNGNAATASRLQTARLISGVPFDGTSNISISATNVGALPITGGTLTGKLTISQSGSTSIALDSATGYDSQLQFTRNSTLRWLFNTDAVAETGSNAGSDLNLYGYNDNGTYAGSVFKVRRTTRQLEFQTQPLSIAAQSTSQYALTRRDFVEAQDALNVSKSGDTMSGSLTFSQAALGVGVKIENSVAGNIGFGNGIVAGTGDGASASTANIQIKSWFGVGIAPAATNPDNINNIWFNARNGDISTIGGLTTVGKTGAAITLKVPSAQSNFILGQTGSGDTWTNSWFVGRGGPQEDVSLYSYTHGTYLRLESDRISFNKPVYTQGYKVLSELDEKVWKNRGQQADLGIASAVLPGYFSFNPGATSSPDNTLYGHGFAVNPGSPGANGVWSSQFAVTHGTPNKLWHRSGINGAAQGNWKKIYTSDDTPTPAEVGAVSLSGDTMTGALIITKSETALSINPPAGTASYILGQQGGTASWYIGKGSSSSNDITLNSYVHSTFISLSSDRININKNIVSSVAQSSLANALTRKDYVDSAISAGDALQVSKSGDTMTGSLFAPSVVATASQNLAAAALTRKDYVDGQIGTRAPTTHNHTAAQANSDIVASSYAQIGTYMFAQKLTTSIANVGTTVAGSSLRPASAGGRYMDGTTLPGTWKCLGFAESTSADVHDRSTLWIRIS